MPMLHDIPDKTNEANILVSCYASIKFDIKSHVAIAMVINCSNALIIDDQWTAIHSLTNHLSVDLKSIQVT